MKVAGIAYKYTNRVFKRIFCNLSVNIFNFLRCFKCHFYIYIAYGNIDMWLIGFNRYHSLTLVLSHLHIELCSFSVTFSVGIVRMCYLFSINNKLFQINIWSSQLSIIYRERNQKLPNLFDKKWICTVYAL